MGQSWSEYSQNENQGARRATFEETYPRYEFAEMVRIGLVIAEWLAAGAGWLTKVSRRMQAARLEMSGRVSTGEVNPAE